jgi:hypothetical protein
MLSFMNINSKERENTANSTLTRRRKGNQKTSASLRSKLELFIWRHVVYVPKSSTTFRGILICVIFRPRDMQEYYMLFGIRVHVPCLFSISPESISNTRMLIYFVYGMIIIVHLLQGSVMEQSLYKHRPWSIYDVIGHG